MENGTCGLHMELTFIEQSVLHIGIVAVSPYSQASCGAHAIDRDLKVYSEVENMHKRQ